jgi:hypothetical protein
VEQQQAETHATKANQVPVSPVYLGMFAGRSTSASVNGVEVAALAVAVVWAIGLAIWLVVAPASGTDPLRVAMSALALGLPLVVALGGIVVARAVRRMRDEAEKLELAVNSLRQAMVTQRQSGVLEMTPKFERKLDEIAAAQRKTEAKIALFTSIRPDQERSRDAATAPAPVPAAPGEQAQPALALEPSPNAPATPLSHSDFIRALNFPDDTEDKDGFRALRRAMQDHETAGIVRAAQDILTLLSQDGIYMDDLTPDRARPEIWRRFAQGERGKTVAILGGIRDRSSLALAAGRMRQDTIFRDSAHHFLRKFDQAFSAFEKDASDLEIVSLTDTRSARAFMLLGRVTGIFS